MIIWKLYQVVGERLTDSFLGIAGLFTADLAGHGNSLLPCRLTRRMEDAPNGPPCIPKPRRGRGSKERA